MISGNVSKGTVYKKIKAQICTHPNARMQNWTVYKSTFAILTALQILSINEQGNKNLINLFMKRNENFSKDNFSQNEIFYYNVSTR